MPIVVLNADLAETKVKEVPRKTLEEWYPIGLQETEKPAGKMYGCIDVPASGVVQEVKGSQLMTCSTLKPIYAGNSDNQLLSAVLHAYNNHLSLRLSPDMILQCVAMAVSNCINDHSEEYRDVFVNHAGKKKLVVKVLTPPGVFNWDMLIDLMNDLIDQNVKSNLGLEPTFTTTTRVSKSVAALTKMSSFKKYFEFGFMMCCGIRSVDLTGSLEDWQLLRAKVVSVGELMAKKNHMQIWFGHVLQVVDRLIETYQTVGQVSQDLETFWSRIVTYVPYGSGGQRYISGWIKVLIPGSEYDRFPKNLLILDSKSAEPVAKGDYYGWQDRIKEWAQMTFDEPKGCTFVEAELNDHGLVYDLYCMAGFVGFQVTDGFVEPELGYTVHALAKDTPTVTNEAEVGCGPYTDSIISMRGTDEYRDAQDRNLKVIQQVQKTNTEANDSV